MILWTRWESSPANTRRWANTDLMLVHRLRRWPNMKSAFVQRLVFAGRVGIPGGNVQVICLSGRRGWKYR